MKKNKLFSITKFIMTIILCLIFKTDACYASEIYTKSTININGDTINLNILATDKEKIYGLLGNLNYNQEKLKLVECKSDKYVVTVENNILLLEGIKGYNSAKLATCSFSISERDDIKSIDLTDISLSNSSKVLYNDNLINKIENPPKNNQIESEENNSSSIDDITNPQTNGKSLIIVFIVFSISLVVAFFINKKYKLFSCFVLMFFIGYPIYVSAVSENFKITEEGINEIRSILMKKKSDNTNNKYDYDSDNKLTINDLIMSLIDFNTDHEKDDEQTDPSDKTPPAINSCTAVIENNKTTFSINTNDNDISKYVINDNTALTFTNREHTINEVIENPKITAYDNNNNSSTVNCSSYYSPIIPKGTENIKYQEDKNTLKVWIELNTREGRNSFYTTHIWAKDAYNQFKSQVPDNFGKELTGPQTLLTNAVKQQGLDNKLAVAVNASGFVLDKYYSTDVYKVNPNFNKTSLSPIVLVNGELKRDLALEKLPASVNLVYGLTKNGWLKQYGYPGGDNPDANKTISEQIIADGVKNTFSFGPTLIYNGQLNSLPTGNNIRQGLCQIDKNNFAFITDVYSEARNGFSLKELGEYMISLGCKYGFNLDGGGSTALIYKPSTSTPTSITNPGREIADIIYFHE